MEKDNMWAVYVALNVRLQKRRVIAGIISILIFGGLLLLSVQGFLKIHWFTFLLLSIASGCWLLFFSRLLSWLFFLRPHLKNKFITSKTEYPISNGAKKMKQALINWTVSTGVLLFCFFIFLAQQPNHDGTMPSWGWSDSIGSFVFFTFISIFLFVFSTGVINWFLKTCLFKKTKSYNPLSSLDDFQENYPHTSKTQWQEPHSPTKIWENWNHDPMNPASAEYQSTYRHWNHND